MVNISKPKAIYTSRILDVRKITRFDEKMGKAFIVIRVTRPRQMCRKFAVALQNDMSVRPSKNTVSAFQITCKLLFLPW